jgi:hypothetical protein
LFFCRFRCKFLYFAPAACTFTYTNWLINFMVFPFFLAKYYRFFIKSGNSKIEKKNSTSIIETDTKFDSLSVDGLIFFKESAVATARESRIVMMMNWVVAMFCDPLRLITSGSKLQLWNSLKKRFLKFSCPSVSVETLL